jgi:hypothetical protein
LGKQKRKPAKKPGFLERAGKLFKKPPPVKEKPNPVEVSLRNACNKDDQPFYGFAVGRPSGKVFLSDRCLKNILCGNRLAENVVIIVEDVSGRGATLSVATTDKDGNWLTRLYCGPISRGNSITIDGLPKMLNVDVSQPRGTKI